MLLNKELYDEVQLSTINDCSIKFWAEVVLVDKIDDLSATVNQIVQLRRTQKVLIR